MDRMIKNFIEMTQILSPSKKEKKLADYICLKLNKFSNKIIKDAYGNLIIKINGNKKSKSLLLSAHLDTVYTDKKPKLKLEKNIIRTTNQAILGADCKAGIAIIMEVVNILSEKKISHPPLELVFTSGEEIGLRGSSKLKKMRANFGLVFDNEKNINYVVTKSVGVDNFEILVKGIPSHSGVEPEKGISAIKLIAKITDNIKTGRVSKNTTLNIGFIEGGSGINIVPSLATVKGEIRGFGNNEMKMIQSRIEKTIKKILKTKTQKNGLPSYEFNVIKIFDSFHIEPDNRFLQIIKKAYIKNGIRPIFTESFGGTDANNFYKLGIITPNIPTGMKNVHTPDEYLNIKEFKKSLDITLDIIKEFACE